MTQGREARDCVNIVFGSVLRMYRSAPVHVNFEEQTRYLTFILGLFKHKLSRRNLALHCSYPFNFVFRLNCDGLFSRVDFLFWIVWNGKMNPGLWCLNAILRAFDKLRYSSTFLVTLFHVTWKNCWYNSQQTVHTMRHCRCSWHELSGDLFWFCFYFLFFLSSKYNPRLGCHCAY